MRAHPAGTSPTPLRSQLGRDLDAALERAFDDGLLVPTDAEQAQRILATRGIGSALAFFYTLVTTRLREAKT